MLDFGFHYGIISLDISWNSHLLMMFKNHYLMVFFSQLDKKIRTEYSIRNSMESQKELSTLTL